MLVKSSEKSMKINQTTATMKVKKKNRTLITHARSVT